MLEANLEGSWGTSLWTIKPWSTRTPRAQPAKRRHVARDNRMKSDLEQCQLQMSFSVFLSHMTGRTIPSFKHLHTSTDRRRCTELIMPWSSCRPRDLIQPHRNAAWIRGYISATENLNWSVRDLKRWKIDSGMSTPERAKMLNHCKHRPKPSRFSDAILRTTPHGLIAVILEPSVTDAVTSKALLSWWLLPLSRFKNRCKDKTGYRSFSEKTTRGLIELLYSTAGSK